MDVSSILLSEKVAKVSSDALAVYLLLYADIDKNETVTTKFFKHQNKLVSGFGVQSISQRLGMVPLTVGRALEQLLKCCWVKQLNVDSSPTYQLGEIVNNDVVWFISTNNVKTYHKSVIAKIKACVREKKERVVVRERALPRDVKLDFAEKLVNDIEVQKNPTIRVFNYFKHLYIDKFDTVYIVTEVSDDSEKGYKKAMAMVKTYLRYCDNVYTKAVELLDFVFINWDEIRDELGIVGRPSLDLLSSLKIMKVLRYWKENGIPLEVVEDRVAKRYDHTIAKDVPDAGF